MSIDANEDFTMVFNDSNNEKRMMLFFESGRVTQVRVYDEVTDDKVKCSFVAYSKTHFTKSPLEFLEKEFYRDGKFVNEYYTDRVLESYFETEYMPSFEILRGYSGSGILFNTEVIYRNAKGRPYAYYQQIDDDPGLYRRINSEGAYSEKWFNSFEDCIQHPGEKI